MRKAFRFMLLVLCFISVVLLLSGCGEERKAAIEAYDAECDRINTEVSELNNLIADCEALIQAAEPAYDPETLTALETATTDAKASITEIPDRPHKAEDINSLVEDTLAKISYTATTDSLNAAKDAYDHSVKVLKQVTNPSEEFIVNCIKNIPGIVGYDAVTEDNDPNGNLHKAGGYTSAVYFEYDKVDQSKTYGNTIIEKGTDCGGQLEVYATADDAQKRCDYLASFDGGILASGSHTVVGTILVRTSDKLTASQQKELEELIIAKLIELPD